MLYDFIYNSLKFVRMYICKYGRVIWVFLKFIFKIVFNFVVFITNCKKIRKLLIYLNICVSIGIFI